MPYMKTGESVGANHAFIGAGAGIHKGTASTDGRGHSEDEVCDAGASVGVH